MTDTAQKKQPDNFRLNILYFYLTSYCNLNCGHCWIDPVFRDETVAPAEVDLSALVSVIDQAIPLGLSGIKLTGGEPFLSPHIVPLMRHAASKKIGISIETNGTLITDELADVCRECRVSHIAVSLDGPNPGVHERLRGVKGSFDRAVAGIKKIRARGIQTQVIMSVYRDNVDTVEETVRFAAGLGVQDVKLNCLSNIARARAMHGTDGTLTVSEHIALYAKLKETFYARSPVPVLYDLPPVFTFRAEGERRPGTCGILGILGVLGNGSLSLCGIGRSLPELVFGHITKDAIRDVWENSRVLHDFREKLPNGLKGVCGSCMLRRMCLGKCRAEAYATQGDLFAPFGFCQAAYEQGVYPMKYHYEKKAV